MSSLEERREARRRRRQQEEEEADENEAISAPDKGMPNPRRETENRLSRLAAEVNSFNEEDDYERKRRERREAREARLRSAAVEEETTTRRSSRRHAVEEDEAPAEETRRSRRRRGGDDEETPAEETSQEEPAEDTSEEDPAAAAAAAAAEEARRQQEAEEAARQAAEEERRREEAEEQRKKDEADRERREAEEALRKIEDEKRAAEEAEQRKIEEAKQAAEEAERKKREAEERRKRIREDYSETCEKKRTAFSLQSSRPSYNGNIDEDENSADTDDDDQPKSSTDTSFDNQSGSLILLSDAKDIETESRSYLSSSREEVSDSHTDDGSIEDSPDSNRCSANDQIADVNDIVQDKHFVVNKEETYKTPYKKHVVPAKNFIPNRGCNLKDIQKKDFVDVSRISTMYPVINGFDKKDLNSKTEKLKEVHIQFEMTGTTSTGGAQIKNITVQNAVSVCKKPPASANGTKSYEEKVNSCNKWPPERGRSIKDLSEKYLSSASNDEPHIPADKPLIALKSVVKRWPCAHKAEISKTKVAESLGHYSSEQTNPIRTEIKRDVLSRWPPASDLKQTARESISTAIAQKLNSADVRTSPISATSPTTAPISARWPPVTSTNKETKHSTVSAENRKSRETPIQTTSKQITPQKNGSLWSPPPMHALKKLTVHNSFDSTNNHVTKDAATTTDRHSLTVTHSLDETQTKSNDFHEEEEREEAERKKRQEEAARRRQEEEEKKKKGKRKGLGGLSPEKKKLLKLPRESQPVEEKSLQSKQAHHLEFNKVEELRKRQVLSERIMPLPDNLEELSKVPPSQFTSILCGHDNAECKLIMQKAAEDLKNEAKRKAEERENFINSRVDPLTTDGLNEAQMLDLVKKLHGKMAELEEEVYDWEFKLRRQEFEINDLTLKVNDTRGKFVKPVLRKISKTEAKLAKLERSRKDDFRTTLKSSGHKHDKIDEEEQPAEAEA